MQNKTVMAPALEPCETAMDGIEWDCCELVTDKLPELGHIGELLNCCCICPCGPRSTC